MQVSIQLISLLSALLALVLGLWGGVGLIVWFTFVGCFLYFLVVITTRSLYYSGITVAYFLILSLLSHLVWFDFQSATGSALSGSDDTFFYLNAICIADSGLLCQQDAFSYFLVPFVVLMSAMDTQTNIGVYAITSALTALNFSLCKALSIRYFNTNVPSWLLLSSYFAVAQLFMNTMMLYREALVLLLLFGAIYLYGGSSRFKSGKILLSFLSVAYLRVGSSFILPLFIFFHLLRINSLRRAIACSVVFVMFLTITLNSLAPIVAAYGSSMTNLSRLSAYSEVNGEDILDERMQKRVQGSIGDGRAEALKISAFSSVTPANVALRFLIPTAYPITFRHFSTDMPARHIMTNISIVLKPLVIPLVLLGLLTLFRYPMGAPLLFSLFVYTLLVLLISGMPRHLMPVYWLMPVAAAIGWQRLRGKFELLLYSSAFSIIAIMLVFLNG